MLFIVYFVDDFDNSEDKNLRESYLNVVISVLVSCYTYELSASLETCLLFVYVSMPVNKREINK